MPRLAFSWGVGCLLAILSACSNDDALIKTTAGYPPVELKPSDLPTFAVGDSFTFDNPDETWTVAAVQDGLVTWRSSLGGARKTVFEPFMPPVEWTAADRSTGGAQLTGWDSGLFPLKGGMKTAFKTRARRSGDPTATPYEWKCYSGHPRKVTVAAGAYPAYPVFCRRSDGLTIQSFYAPEVNASLMTTRRKRPDDAEKRELVAFNLAKGPRIAATTAHGLPAGVALAAVEQSVRPPQPTVTAVADTRGSAPAAAPPAAPAQIARGPAARSPAPPSPTAPPMIAPPPTAAATPAPPPAAAPAAARAPAPRPPAAAARPVAPAAEGAPTIAPPPLIAPPGAAKPPPALALAHPAEPPKPKAAGAATDGFGAQIASYRDAGNVERGWVALRERYKPLLNGAGRVVVPVDLGGSKGLFHRLLAGPFGARSTAEQLCRSIRTRGAACIVQPIGR